MRGLTGKRAIVTGGASGIGLAIARRLAAEGAVVAVLHHGQAELAADEVAQLGPGGHLAIEADVGSEAAIEAAFDRVVDRLGGVELLACSAGTKRPAPTDAYPLHDWNLVHDVNLRGPYLCARAFLTRRPPAGSAAVFVSSVHEITPFVEDVAYAASKAGLAGLVRTLAVAHGPDGIRFNNLAPGGVITPMNPSWTQGSADLQAFEALVPLKRAAMPEEMASVAAFLLSDEAAYVTGHTLVADGGIMWGSPGA